MGPRMRYAQVDPDSLKAMRALEQYIHDTGMDKNLIELIKIRASQLNGCAFCLDMHTKDARAMGETEQRLYLLNVWKESLCYTETERVALELTEALTLISTNQITDDLYERVRKYFDAKQYVQLIMVINTINCWNRLSIATGAVPGEYQSTKK